MACNLIAVASNGLQPTSDGLEPNSTSYDSMGSGCAQVPLSSVVVPELRAELRANLASPRSPPPPEVLAAEKGKDPYNKEPWWEPVQAQLG